MNDWLFEWHEDGESYTFGNLSVEFLANYFERVKHDAYFCLFDNDTEESLKIYGNFDEYIIEVFINFKNKYSNFVLTKNKKTECSKSIEIFNHNLIVEENEIFEICEVVNIIKDFQKNKTINKGVKLIEKAFFP